MENRPNPQATTDPPKPLSYEDRVRQQRAAAKAKLEKPATPVPVQNDEAEDAFFEEYSEYDDFSLSELFESWKSKFKNPFKKIHFTFPKVFKKPSFSLPKIFKKKSDKEKSAPVSKEDSSTMEKKSGKIKTAFTWLNRKLDALCKSLLFGIIVAIILNVITKFFWPELPTKIPTVYSFFNGFLTVTEFAYKTALGGITALFTGNLQEFSLGVVAEIKEMWNTFCVWMSSIHF